MPLGFGFVITNSYFFVVHMLDTFSLMNALFSSSLTLIPANAV
jgi:hypothetical protein